MAILEKQRPAAPPAQKSIKSSSQDEPVKEVRNSQDIPPLSEQEVTFMLQHFSSCTFEGRDVLLLASVVAKLQGMLQEG